MFSHGCGAAAEGCKYRPGPTAQLVEPEENEDDEASLRRFDSKHYLARRSDTGDKDSDRLTCKRKGHTLIMLIGSDHTRLGTSRNLFHFPLPSRAFSRRLLADFLKF